jgi:hypothetical protein
MIRSGAIGHRSLLANLRVLAKLSHDPNDARRGRRSTRPISQQATNRLPEPRFNNPLVCARVWPRAWHWQRGAFSGAWLTGVLIMR